MKDFQNLPDNCYDFCKPVIPLPKQLSGRVLRLHKKSHVPATGSFIKGVPVPPITVREAYIFHETIE